MRKKVGIIKRVFCIVLIFLLSINSFAAIVSDNDGSAFITKAEFDALKSSFQSQIDSYNQSIDSKIDGAIASYLAGIRLSTSFDEYIIYNDFGGGNIKWCSASLWPAWTTRTRWEIGGDICFWWGLQPGSQSIRSQPYSPSVAPVYIVSGMGVGASSTTNMRCYYVEYDDSISDLPRLKNLKRYSIYASLSNIYMYHNSPSATTQNRMWWDFDALKNGTTEQATLDSGHGTFVSASKNIAIKSYNAGSFSDYEMYTFGNGGDTDQIFCLKSSESDKLGHKLGDYEQDGTVLDKTTGPSTGWQWQGTPLTGYNMIYSIKVSNIRDFNFNDTATFKPIDELYFSKSTEANKVKLYQGIPLFTASATGHVKIEDMYSGSGNVRIAISDDKFGKESPWGMKITKSRASITQTSSGGRYYYTVPDTNKFDVEFDVEKGKTYYIKVSGSGTSDYSFVKFNVDGPITTVGE